MSNAVLDVPVIHGGLVTPDSPGMGATANTDLLGEPLNSFQEQINRKAGKLFNKQAQAHDR